MQMTKLSICLEIQIKSKSQLLSFFKIFQQSPIEKLKCVQLPTLAANLGSYTQGRTAGDLLSSRKDAWVERYTPKTTATKFEGS